MSQRVVTVIYLNCCAPKPQTSARVVALLSDHPVRLRL